MHANHSFSSNAWALELATSQNPHAGSLITFAQFILVSIYGFWKHVTVVPVPTARKTLLRRVAAKIVEQHSTKTLARQRTYVAIEGSNSDAFADELAHAVELLSHMPTQRFSCSNDVLPQLDGLWVLDIPENSVVLVDGNNLHAGDFRTRWNYSVFLVSCHDIPIQGSHVSPPVDSSLTVDISSQTHPIIVSALPTHFNPMDLLRMLTQIRLKKRSIPISRWGVQVALFLITSLLNNAAFGYAVPMTVHIIFRSGGLVVNMLLGYLVEGRRYVRYIYFPYEIIKVQHRYNVTQILSVILVTLGVICTTLSASQPAPSRVSSASSSGHYSVGILILTLALIMSGFMGLAQDSAYAKYGRGHWQEAMFYLHFLALPGFIIFWRNIAHQFQVVNASKRVAIGLEAFGMPLVKTGHMNVSGGQGLGHTMFQELLTRRVSIPSFYFPLMLNVVTQLVCVSGVHRLTSRVNSLTVTLVLVVRKAASLAISVTLLKQSKGGEALLWIGAGLVLAGTIGYTTGASPMTDKTKKAQKAQKTE